MDYNRSLRGLAQIVVEKQEQKKPKYALTLEKLNPLQTKSNDLWFNNPLIIFELDETKQYATDIDTQSELFLEMIATTIHKEVVSAPEVFCMWALQSYRNASELLNWAVFTDEQSDKLSLIQLLLGLKG